MPGRQAGPERPLVPVGEADGVFDADRARVRSQPTALGTLIWLAAAAKMTPGSGGDPQTTGLQWTVVNGALLEARVDGQPIDRSRTSTLAISNFTAIGGDGYPKMGNHPGYVNTGLNDAEVLRAYIAARSPLKLAEYAPDNR
jgi:5'-nucleotidase/UDP-sugar diphosphatase